MRSIPEMREKCMKQPIKSFEIALSAIACAVAAVALTVGSYVDFLLAAGYLLAVFALMVPLAKNFVWGYVLAFLGGCLLAFCFGAFALYWNVLPFVVFFGLHPLVNYLQRRFFKKKWLHAVAFAVKAVWFCLTMWLMWVTLAETFGFAEASWYDFVLKYFYYVLFIGGTLLFAVYDCLIFFCQRSVDRAVARIRR